MPKVNTFCESFKGNRKFALQVKKSYVYLIRTYSSQATNGNKKAPMALMKVLSERNIVLYHLGFYLGDSNRLKKL